MSVYEKLNKLSKEKRISFHMPGHKNGRLIEPYYQNNWLMYDITEIYGVDDLHHPEGCIKQTHETLEKLHQSRKSYMMVNGSTGGILAMIMSQTDEGDNVLIYRNCHKSVYNAVIMHKLNPLYLYPTINHQYGLPESINLQEIENHFKNNNIKAFVITYPTYEGVAFDLKKVSALCHQYNVLLLVDEAHGPHFFMSEKLPQSAIKSGADIVVQSYHKTMPALTQSAVLHVGSNRVNIQQLEFYLGMLQTSSPSYLLMTSMDIANKIAQEKGGALIEDQLKSIDLFTQKVETMTEYLIVNQRHLKAYDFDATKIILWCGDQTHQVEELLREEYHIYSEYQTSQYILFMVSIGNQIEDLETLSEAIIKSYQRLSSKQEMINKINLKDQKQRDSITTHIGGTYSVYGEGVMTQIPPYQAISMDGEWIDIESSLDRIVKIMVTPYPPGVPLLCVGEKINSEILSQLLYLFSQNYNINGIKEGKICVVKENI